MRWFGRSGAAAAAGMWLGLGVALGAGDASAASTSATLGVQLGPQKTGNYGTVTVNEVSGGALEFRITLASSVGRNADLHEFYFNLPSSTTGVHLTSSSCGSGSCNTPFQLASDTPTSGGAGARFDYRVSFGKGGSEKGNGNLQVATFRIEASAPLHLTPTPFDPSFTQRDLGVIFAAHVPGIRQVAAGIGSTNAMVVPEPGTGVLLGVGLLGLGLRRRR